MAYQLPALPYAFDALEPMIDAKTMEIHHDKHHGTYVNNLNKALQDLPQWAALDIEELVARLAEVPENVRTAVRNNGGGHYNHSLFWQMMAPADSVQYGGDVAVEIDKAFGSFEAFKDLFAKAAAGRFGSGWAWLVWNGNGLEVLSTPNQDNPLTEGKRPILCLDVWEHAYYLKYQNRRAEYIDAFFHVINWDFVNSLLAKAKA